MATKNLRDDFQLEVDQRLKELQNILDSAEKQSAISVALVEYSKDNPSTRSADVTGDAGFDYELSTTNFPSYEDGFSFFTVIEYPYSSTASEPNSIEDEDWIIYQAGTTKYLRFITAKPAATETIRAHYTIPRVFDAAGDTTLPLSDYLALCDLSAAKALRAIASKFIATGDSTLTADSVNYRNKSREALDLAKKLEEDYRSHMGLKEGDSAPAASLTKDWDTKSSWQGDHLTHPARWR